MVYTYHLNNLRLETGDLICTTDGGKGIVGRFWSFIGRLIPGQVDHIVIYVGPGGRCVEAGARGRVFTFDIAGNIWDAKKMCVQRYHLTDTLYGVAYPLKKRGLSEKRITEIREGVAAYVLAQAHSGKLYNLNFLNPGTDNAFYCSQLAYKAYLAHGIDLNTEKGIPNIPGTEQIVLPQEIWDRCYHVSVSDITGEANGTDS